MPALFQPGRIMATDGANEAIPTKTMLKALRRHLAGDFGEMEERDQKANLWAIQNGARVFSAYSYGRIRFFIVTEPDRSISTILLASEY